MDAIIDRVKQNWVIVAVAVVIGIALGLTYGWGISPVQWKDATPALLRPDLRADFLRMAIDSYTVNKDVDLAMQRYQALGASGPETLKEVGADPGEVNPTAIQNFSALVEIFQGGPTSEPVGQTTQVAEGTQASGATPVPTAAPASTGSRASSYVLPVCGVTLLLGLLLLGALILRGRMGTTTEETALDEAYDMPDPYSMPEDYTADVPATMDEPYPPTHSMPDTMPSSTSDFGQAVGAEQPAAEALGTFRTIYNLGDDIYDDSFSIESPSGDFLGECGVGIGDVMGAGEPKKVSAFEVWLFDKNDIQTVTKVLMSKYANNDEATRNQLAAKGDPVLAENGAIVTLETESLVVEARIVDMSYGQSALPAESFFDQMTIEINAYPR
jgi:hypothetical protein